MSKSKKNLEGSMRSLRTVIGVKNEIICAHEEVQREHNQKIFDLENQNQSLRVYLETTERGICEAIRGLAHTLGEVRYRLTKRSQLSLSRDIDNALGYVHVKGVVGDILSGKGLAPRVITKKRRGKARRKVDRDTEERMTSRCTGCNKFVWDCTCGE